MRRLVYPFIIIIMLSIPAMAQVDTLMLQQSYSFAAPGGIRMAVDLLYDNTKELVCVQSSHIYICDINTGEVIWTSPTLASESAHPWYITFKDMNFDDDLDLILVDYPYVKIFDVIHPALLWTSPDTTHPGKMCFGVGDRNSDGFQDVIITRRALYNNDTAPEIVTISIYDGPFFQNTSQFTFNAIGYYDNINYTKHEEYPSSISVEDISDSQGLARKIVIFMNYDRDQAYYDGVYVHFSHSYDGSIKLVNPTTFAISTASGVGQLVSYSMEQTDQAESLCVYSIAGYDYHNDHGDHRSVCSDYINQLSATQLTSHDTIWTGDTHWGTWIRRSKVADIDPANPGKEVCLAIDSTIRLVSYPGATLIWSMPTGVGLPDYIDLFRLSTLSNAAQILFDCYTSFIAFDGADGGQSAVFTGVSPANAFINDLNNDGDDEFVLYRDDNIHIYHVGRISSAIDSGEPLCSSFSLHAAYPNPFNAQTIISYDLPKEADVRLEIYDLLGRRIATLAEGMQEAGSHQTVWDGSGVSSGIYFYRLKAGDYTDIKKMTLLQ
jgi:hypothetical protein